MRAALSRLLDVATLPTDSHDLLLQKRLQVAMSLASVPVIALWGGVFLAQGHPGLALYPLGYCVATIAMLALLAATRGYAFFRVAHPLLVMLGPFALHWKLGGFVGSGGALLWSMLAPVAAMMFVGPRRSVPMFGLMILLVVAGAVREGPLAPAAHELTAREVSFHFAFNTTGFVAFLYLSTRYFVSRIDAEKARSDRLLLNILPATIAERLKREEAVIADRHEEATVLFTDIVGFTPLAARLEARQVVLLLDAIFTAFDDIAARFGLEKIKTIGDAYMLVGGVPNPCADHAERVADAALAMREVVARFAEARGLSMRIGVHTGPVVAGVIGRSKFAYDLWGDTVNTASRMESHGAPGRIHVSEATRAALGDAFAFEERGTVALKGKGEMRTFWLERRA